MKGSTEVGYALSKHAGRPKTTSYPGVSGKEVWGTMKGSQPTWNEQGMKHLREVLRAPGEFKQVQVENLFFLEKRLPDKRGVRLQMDTTFKGVID